MGSTVGLLVDDESRLHLYIDGIDQGVATTDLPAYVYAVIDLYGQCEQISIVGPLVVEVVPEIEDNATASAMERLAIETEDVENSREKADLEYHEKENGASALADEMTVELSVDQEGRCEGGRVQLDETTATSKKDNDLANKNSISNNKGTVHFI